MRAQESFWLFVITIVHAPFLLLTYNSILYISICAVVYGLLKKKKSENRVKIKIKIKGKPEDLNKIGLKKNIENNKILEESNSTDNINKDLKATFNTLSHEEKLQLIDPDIWG